MRKGKRITRRMELAALRAKVIPHIVQLEKKYGVSAVSAAFSRHQQIRRERRKLERAAHETAEKLARLGA